MKDELTIGKEYEIADIDPYWSYIKDKSPSVRVTYNDKSDYVWCSLADFIPSHASRDLSGKKITKITFDIETHSPKKYTKLTSGDGIKVGDTLRITGKPSTWCSEFTKANPLDSNYNIIYPIEVVIEKYTKSYGGAILAGGFGWSIDGMIRAGVVELVENSSPMLPIPDYSGSTSLQQAIDRVNGRSNEYDPSNIIVDDVLKATPVAARVTVSPLQMVNVPLNSPIRTKTIDRITTKSNLIQI